MGTGVLGPMMWGGVTRRRMMGSPMTTAHERSHAHAFQGPPVPGCIGARVSPEFFSKYRSSSRRGCRSCRPISQHHHHATTCAHAPGCVGVSSLDSPQATRRPRSSTLLAGWPQRAARMRCTVCGHPRYLFVSTNSTLPYYLFTQLICLVQFFFFLWPSAFSSSFFFTASWRASRRTPRCGCTPPRASEAAGRTRRGRSS